MLQVEGKTNTVIHLLTKGQGCTDALLTISHHLQKSLNAEIEFYIVQVDFSAAFDSEAQWSLIQIEIY